LHKFLLNNDSSIILHKSNKVIEIYTYCCARESSSAISLFAPRHLFVLAQINRIQFEYKDFTILAKAIQFRTS